MVIRSELAWSTCRGDVFDVVIGSQQCRQVGAHGVAVLAGVDENVRGQRGLGGGDLPDMQVVDLCA
jgi:hypothetical protein